MHAVLVHVAGCLRLRSQRREPQSKSARTFSRTKCCTEGRGYRASGFVRGCPNVPRKFYRACLRCYGEPLSVNAGVQIWNHGRDVSTHRRVEEISALEIKRMLEVRVMHPLGIDV